MLKSAAQNFCFRKQNISEKITSIPDVGVSLYCRNDKNSEKYHLWSLRTPSNETSWSNDCCGPGARFLTWIPNLSWLHVNHHSGNGNGCNSEGWHVFCVFLRTCLLSSSIPISHASTIHCFAFLSTTFESNRISRLPFAFSRVWHSARNCVFKGLEQSILLTSTSTSIFLFSHFGGCQSEMLKSSDRPYEWVLVSPTRHRHQTSPYSSSTVLLYFPRFSDSSYQPSYQPPALQKNKQKKEEKLRKTQKKSEKKAKREGEMELSPKLNLELFRNHHHHHSTKAKGRRRGSFMTIFPPPAFPSDDLSWSPQGEYF